VTVSDALVLLGLLVALIAWSPHRGLVVPARAALLCASGFALLVLISVPLTLQEGGRDGLFLMRHLSPFLLVPLLPSARPLQRLSPSSLATLVSVALIALGVRSVYLLSTGFVARSSVGEQRIYQTWEPFIAAALALVLLAFVLAADRPRPLHLFALFASLVPVIFAFFRTAWVFEAVLGAVLIITCSRPGRRTKLLGGLLVVAVAGVLVANAVGSGGRTYAEQVRDRFSEITTTLDRYRIDEIAAVNREIEKAPILGSGFGTRYGATWTDHTLNAHNSYQWLWWRVGLLGLALFLAMFILPMVSAVMRRQAMAADDRALAQGLVAGLAFTLLAANLQENFENYQTNIVAALMLAQLVVVLRRPYQPS
jgi:O-antigen ligase